MIIFNISRSNQATVLKQMKAEDDIQFNEFRSFSYTPDVTISNAPIHLSNDDYCIMYDTSGKFGGLYLVYPKNQAKSIYEQFDLNGSLSGFSLSICTPEQIKSKNLRGKLEKELSNCLFVTNVGDVVVNSVSNDAEVIDL